MEERKRMEMEEAEMRKFKAQPVLEEYELNEILCSFISISCYD